MSARALLCALCLASTLAFSQAPAVRSGGTVTGVQSTLRAEVAFAPWDQPARRIIDVIDAARRSVRVQAFNFTHRRIAEALTRAQRRGVSVEVVADRDEFEKQSAPMVTQLAAAGIPVWLDGNFQSAHNKVMVIDARTPSAVVITGSFNFTQAAANKNAENVVLLFGDNDVTRAYADNWLRHRERAIRLQ